MEDDPLVSYTVDSEDSYNSDEVEKESHKL